MTVDLYIYINLVGNGGRDAAAETDYVHEQPEMDRASFLVVRGPELGHVKWRSLP